MRQMHTRHKNSVSRLFKSNLIVCVISALLISCLTIGYSLLSKQLSINTSITIQNAYTTRISSVSVYTPVNGAYEVYEASYTPDTFTSNVYLPNIDSKISYDITITNSDSKKMKIKSIVSSVYNNMDIEYKVTGVSVGDVINSNTSLTFTLTFEYNVSSLPDNMSLGSIFEFEYEEYIETREYVNTSKILDLRGYEMPSNNQWVDIRNNKAMNLNNVFYNSIEKNYDFSNSGAYATLGEAIIPITGDFTLEAFVGLSLNSMSTNDQAIVAQVSDGENDAGRFKLNAKVDGDLQLLVFFNSQSPSTNQFLYFNRNVIPGKNYHMQVVRTGNELKLYLDGIFVSTNTYTADNTISNGPFKIGKWRNNDLQQFIGRVYSVRVYDRALTELELQNNYEIDADRYFETSLATSLKEYALGKIVTSGNGLYNTGTNTYKYKGVNINNYIKFSDSNDLYRIVSFNDDNTIKIFNTSLDITTAFDASGNRAYDAITNLYCNKASTHLSDADPTYYGCNAYCATMYNGLTVDKDSTIKTVVDNWYQNLDTKIKDYVVPHTYNAGIIIDLSSYSSAVLQNSSITYTSNVGLLDIVDVLDASTTATNSISSTIRISNYIIKSVSSTAGLWLSNGSNVNTYDSWLVIYGTQLAKRRASRESQVNGTVTAYFKAKPAITIYDDVYVTGIGSINSPFVITGRGE